MKLSKSLLQAIAAGVIVAAATTSCEKIKDSIDFRLKHNAISVLALELDYLFMQLLDCLT